MQMYKFKTWLRKRILFYKFKKIAKEMYGLQRRIRGKSLMYRPNLIRGAVNNMLTVIW